MEGEKQYTPEEIANLEKSRTISDADLLKGGAEYQIGKDGNKQLVLEEDQIEDIAEEKRESSLMKMLDQLEKEKESEPDKPGRKVRITFRKKEVNVSSNGKESIEGRFEGFAEGDAFSGLMIDVGDDYVLVNDIENIELID